MTNSPLEQWKEKKRREFDKRYGAFEFAPVINQKGFDNWSAFLDTYAQELLGLVRESVVPKAEYETDCQHGPSDSCDTDCMHQSAAIHFNACRAQIEANFERLCGDVKPKDV